MTIAEAAVRPDAEPGPSTTSTWRTRLGITLSVAGITAALAVPAPDRMGAAGGAADASTGPRTIASTWPAAKKFPIPAFLTGGLSYHPEVILDATTSVGVAATADQLHVSLVIVPTDGTPQVLKTGDAGGSFDSITASGDRLFWIQRSADSTGQQRASLWQGDRKTGKTHQMTTDVGDPESNGSRYDLQIIGDRVYWAESDPDGAATTLVRSVPLSGGTVTTRTVAGIWQMSAWPWITVRATPGQPYELLNLDTGRKRTVRMPAGKMAECSPAWCRVMAGNADQIQDTTLMHLDGSAARRVTGAEASPVSGEVALENRFEPLLGGLSASAKSTASPLMLYDLKTDNTVLLEPAATNARASGHHVWWSTGDNEATAWQGIDLRSLR